MKENELVDPKRVFNGGVTTDAAIDAFAAEAMKFVHLWGEPPDPWWSMSQAQHEAETAYPWTCQECRAKVLNGRRRCGHTTFWRADGSIAFVPQSGVVRAIRRNEYRHPLLAPEAQPLTPEDEQALCRVLKMLDQWQRKAAASNGDGGDDQ